MKKCKLCGSEFRVRMLVDGKIRNLQRRKYCLDCSPFGSGNTIKLSRYGESFDKIGKSHTNEIGRKKRARDNKWYRGYQRNKRKQRKQELVELKGGKCERCGYNECFASLNFHHRNPNNKRGSLSELNLLSKWKTLVEEVRKCKLLCKNCHTRLHFLESTRVV